MFPQRDWFHKTRAYCHSLKKSNNLPMTRDQMRKRIETDVFSNPAFYKKVLDPKEDVILSHYSKYDPYKKLKPEEKPSEQIVSDIFMKYFNDPNLPDYINTNLQIHEIIPELERKNVKTQTELLNAIGRLTHKNMVFLNKHDKNLVLNAILYLPYTPEFIIKKATNEQIIFLCMYYNLEIDTFTFAPNSKYPGLIAIGKQKLIDLFYLAIEISGAHLVVNCRGNLVSSETQIQQMCPEVASTHCRNYLCRSCCLKTKGKPCMIHHNPTIFYKYEVEQLICFETEKKLDETKTLRLSLAFIGANLLDQILEGYIRETIFKNEVNIDQVIPFFNDCYERLTHFYIVLKDPNDKQKVLNAQNDYLKNIDNTKFINISLNTLFPKCLENIENTFPTKNSLLMCQTDYILKNIIKTENEMIKSNKDIDQQLHSLLSPKPEDEKHDPSENEDTFEAKIDALENTIENLIQKEEIGPETFTLNDFNGSLKMFKLSCSSKKLLEIICKHQPFHDNIICFTKEELMSFGCNQTDKKVSMYDETLGSFTDLDNFVFEIAKQKLEVDFKIKSMMREGNTNWFLIHSPYMTQEDFVKMRQANREILNFIDDPQYQRGTKKVFEEDFRLFSFQTFEPTLYMNKSKVKAGQCESKENDEEKDPIAVELAVDKVGEFYIQYYFTKPSLDERISQCDKDKQRLFGKFYDLPINLNELKDLGISVRNEETYEKEFKANKAMMGENRKLDNFDLIITGLDCVEYTKEELNDMLIQEFIKHFGEFDKSNLVFLDSISLLNFVNQNVVPSLLEEDASRQCTNISGVKESAMEKLGFVVLVKFKSTIDALEIFTEEKKLCIPLSNCTKDHPSILMSNKLMKELKIV